MWRNCVFFIELKGGEKNGTEKQSCEKFGKYFSRDYRGQISYLRRHGGAFIESCDEISVTDLKSVANDIFNTYVHDGKLMLKEMQTTFSHEFHILLDWIYGKIFTLSFRNK